MWLSTDPAMGEYIPQAPLNDEAKKYNGNLPGMGGVFNTVNLHTYHYAGNNPVKYTDPNGREDDLPATKPSATNQSEGYNVGKSEFNHFQFSYLLVEGTGIGGSFTVQGQINIFQDAEGNYKANIDVFAFSYGASNAGDVEWFSSSYIKVDGKKVAEANLAIKPELKDKPNYIGSVTINLPSPKSNKDFTVHIKVNYKVTMPEGRAFPLFWYDRKVRIFKGSEK
jgi:hypothetical protein